MYDIILLMGTIFGTFLLLYILISRQVNGIVISTQTLIDEKINGIFDQLGDAFEESVSSPMTKRAMSILGKMGGDSASQSGLVEQMAQDVLNGPQLAGIKMIGNALGFNIDEYLETHGAMNTLMAIKQFAPMMNIDLSSLATEGLGGILKKSGGSDENPYLGG